MLVQRWLERAPLLRRITNLQMNVMQAAYDAGVRNIQVTGDSNLVVKTTQNAAADIATMIVNLRQIKPYPPTLFRSAQAPRSCCRIRSRRPGSRKAQPACSAGRFSAPQDTTQDPGLFKLRPLQAKQMWRGNLSRTAGRR